MIVVAIAATSCYREAQSSEITSNDIKVEFLFEKDNVKMYRFFDGGRYHYFTSKGETIVTQHAGETEYQENIQ